MEIENFFLLKIKSSRNFGKFTEIEKLKKLTLHAIPGKRHLWIFTIGSYRVKHLGMHFVIDLFHERIRALVCLVRFIGMRGMRYFGQKTFLIPKNVTEYAA